MSTTIYKIINRSTGTTTLVEGANNPAQAMRVVARDMFEVSPAKPAEVLSLVRAGTTVLPVKTEAE